MAEGSASSGWKSRLVEVVEKALCCDAAEIWCDKGTAPSKGLAAVGVTGLVGLLGADGSVLSSLVRFFLRNPRVGIKEGLSSRQAGVIRWDPIGPAPP